MTSCGASNELDTESNKIHTGYVTISARLFDYCDKIEDFKIDGMYVERVEV